MCPHSVFFSFNLCVLAYSKEHSLCSSAVLMPWFLMNYVGRVLQQVTGRMVRFKKAFFSSLFLGFYLHTFSLFGHKRASFPCRHSDTTNPRAFLFLPVLSHVLYRPHIHCSFSPGDCWTWLQSENLAEVGLLLLFRFRCGGVIFFCLVPNTDVL